VHSQEQEHRRSGVARVVESAIPYSRSLEELLPVVPVSTRLQRSANLVTEDPPLVNPQLSGRPSLDRLSFSVSRSRSSTAAGSGTTRPGPKGDCGVTSLFAPLTPDIWPSERSTAWHAHQASHDGTSHAQTMTGR